MLILIIFPCLDKWHRAKRFVPYQGYQQGYVGQEEQLTNYPEHQPIGGSTRAYNPPHQMTAKIQPNPVWPTPGQPNPVISCSQMRNNRRKRQRATQGAVTYPVQRAAPPGQRWILVPEQPSSNETPQTRCLEDNSTPGTSEAPPPQPGPEPEIKTDNSTDDDETPKLQTNESDKLYVRETVTRMEQAARESRTELQQGLAILMQILNWLKNIGVQNNQTYQRLLTLGAEHKKATAQSSAQFQEQHGTLMELTRVVEGYDAERESQMDMLTRSMTELVENVRTIAQARVPHAQQELTKDIGRNAVRCQQAADKLTDLILNV